MSELSRESSVVIPDEAELSFRVMPWLWNALAFLSLVFHAIWPHPTGGVFTGVLVLAALVSQLRLDHRRTQLLLLHIYKEARR